MSTTFILAASLVLSILWIVAFGFGIASYAILTDKHTLELSLRFDQIESDQPEADDGTG